ncbi:MAG: hypothetical protein LBC81_01645 [Tannerellaceae bacterium]|jgi:hypothetical protein|nr:hypothetical protein [Tannerellaceae bacterium]
MKHLIYFILIIASLASCDSYTANDSDNMGGTNAKDTISVYDTMKLGLIPDRFGIEILITDSNNVSVFDPQGKNWSREDIHVTYPYVSPTTGREDIKSFKYDKDYIPRGHLETCNINFSTRSIIEEKFWLAIHVNLYDSSEFRTSFLRFPDNTVDTVLAQVELTRTYFNYYYCNWHNIWYNGKLVLSSEWRPHSEEEVEALGYYPDGSKVLKDTEFQIIK